MSTDPVSVCAATQGALHSVGDQSTSIIHSIDNLHKIMSDQGAIDFGTRMTVAGVLMAEAQLKNQILKSNLDVNAATCAQDAVAYVDTLNKVIQTSNNIAAKAQERLEDKMRNSGNADVKNLLDTQKSLESESQRRQILIGSTGVMNDIERDRDLREIKLALFGTQPGFLFSKDSPSLPAT